MAPVGLVAVSVGAAVGLTLAIVLVGAGAAWFAIRMQPENRLDAARRQLVRGDFRSALALARRLKPKDTEAPQPWHDERRLLEGECLYAASEVALRERRFDEALGNYRAAAALLGLSEADATRRVVEAMLAELRHLSAANPEHPALPELVRLILERQSPCPEASFWLGLYLLRRGETLPGVAALAAVHQAVPGRQVDTALYLGAVAQREGRPRDALRALAEANRLAPNCPLVSWQLGMSLLAAGGDAVLGVRALQKALGPDGLGKYVREPNRLWAETLPAESWVRNLAQRAITQRIAFRCPLGLDRLESVIRSARLALAEALEASGRAAEAVPIYNDLLKADDFLPVRRGLGLALTQLERYDLALPHLRAAYEGEKQPQARTVGALALCLTRTGEDRVENVHKALALVGSMKVRSDADWARRAGAVFAAAEAVGVPVAPGEIAELAAVLASTAAADPAAAAIYDLLAGVAPDRVSPECAWLYVRAAEQHNLRLAHDAALFDRAMTDRSAAQAFFTAHEWDFDAAERLYLERWAEQHAGSFPTAPGPRYAAAAEAALLADSRRQEAHNRLELADAIARLALRLAPDSGAAHDRLAELAYRRGESAAAADWLTAWHKLHRDDPRPLARLAALAYQQNRPADALTTLRRALKRARGPERAPFAFLGARFALAAGQPAEAVELLDECLTFDADHSGALACRVALAWSTGEFDRLAALAERMASLPAEDPWFLYLAGVSLFLTGNLKTAEGAARAAAMFPETAPEGQHLLGLIRLRQDDAAGAAEALRRATAAAGGAAHDHAFALRGQAAWRAGDDAEALRCWQAIPAARLKAWQLDAVLPGTAFLAGLQALRAGHPEQGIQWLRQATQLGHADPRLEPLLTAACLRAGERSDTAERVIARLEKALAMAGPQPEVVRRLARAYRRQNRLADARRLLAGAPADEPVLALERGLMFVAENQLVPAEKVLAEADQRDPHSPAACLNLVFVRLSLGRLTDAAELLPRAFELSPLPSQQRLLGQLRALAAGAVAGLTGWTAEDDRIVMQCLRSLGRLESVEPLFGVLATARPLSPVVKQAQAELVPLLAKDRINRGDSEAARTMLEAHLAVRSSPLVHNLLGICACLRQDFAAAARHFQSALPPAGDDARVQQNLALVRGWMGDARRAAAHWQRFSEYHATQTPKPPGVPDYHKRIGALVKEKQNERAQATV